MDKMSIRDLCRDARLSPSQAATLTGKTDRQFRRYLNGSAPIPLHVINLLRFASGDLSLIHSEWCEWILSPFTGSLVSPNGEVYTQEWFPRLHFHFQKLASERARMRAEIRELKQEVNLLKSVRQDEKERAA